MLLSLLFRWVLHKVIYTCLFSFQEIIEFLKTRWLAITLFFPTETLPFLTVKFHTWIWERVKIWKCYATPYRGYSGELNMWCARAIHSRTADQNLGSPANHYFNENRWSATLLSKVGTTWDKKSARNTMYACEFRVIGGFVIPCRLCLQSYCANDLNRIKTPTWTNAAW